MFDLFNLKINKIIIFVLYSDADYINTKPVVGDDGVLGPLTVRIINRKYF